MRSWRIALHAAPRRSAKHLQCHAPSVLLLRDLLTGKCSVRNVGICCPRVLYGALAFAAATQHTKMQGIRMQQQHTCMQHVQSSWRQPLCSTLPQRPAPVRHSLRCYAKQLQKGSQSTDSRKQAPSSLTGKQGTLQPQQSDDQVNAVPRLRQMLLCQSDVPGPRSMHCLRS